MDVVERVKAAVFGASVPHKDVLGEGSRSVGYYTSAGIDYFQHPHDRFEKLQDLAARAAIAAVLDSMAEPSHDVTAAVVKPMQDRTWAVEAWQAMLAAMRAEMLGATGETEV